MAIKKLTLTEDMIKLIGALQMSKFSFGDRLNTTKLDNAIEDIQDNRSRIEELEKKNGVSENKMNEDLASFDMCIESLAKAKAKIKDICYEKDHYAYGVDQFSLWGGNYVNEDIANILGRQDELIDGCQEMAEGPMYKEEFEQYARELYDFITTNMDYILTLVFQFSTKGGLTPGTYKCINYQTIWEKVE